MEVQIFKLLVSAVMWFWGWRTDKGEREKRVIEFQKIMNQKGLTSVTLRLMAEEQREGIREQWEQIESGEKTLEDFLQR